MTTEANPLLHRTLPALVASSQSRRNPGDFPGLPVNGRIILLLSDGREERFMATWKPNQSFYPSPPMAMKAASKWSAHVAAYDTGPAQGSSPLRRPKLMTGLHFFGCKPCSFCLYPNARTRTMSAPTWWCRACALPAFTFSTPSQKPRTPNREVFRADRQGGHAATHRPLGTGRPDTGCYPVVERFEGS